MGTQREEGVSACGRMASASALLSTSAKSVTRIWDFCNQTPKKKKYLSKLDGSLTLKSNRAPLTLHKLEPCFLSPLCKGSRVHQHQVKHNPSCSRNRNKRQATWSLCLSPPGSHLYLSKFQIKMEPNRSPNEPPQKLSGLESSTTNPGEKGEVGRLGANGIIFSSPCRT